MARYRAIILGEIWWPVGLECSTEREYTAETDADAIEAAQTVEAGDFSSVRDVQVIRWENYHLYRVPTVMVKDWDTEENEMAYLDTVSEGDE